MMSNVGSSDRGIRILLGIVLIVSAAARVFTGSLVLAAYVVGAIALVTGLIRYVPRGRFLESTHVR
jgi:hypothetical protein